MLSPIEGVAFNELPGVRHGFFNRVGGVSKGIYWGLNTGIKSYDSPDDIAENRRRVANHLGVGTDQLVSPLQVHGIKVATLASPRASGLPPEADAVVTASRGVAVGVLTADCAPVLLAEPKAGVVGAA